MKKTVILIIIAAMLFPFVAAQPTTCIYFFYGNGCPHCAEVEPYLDSLQDKYPELDIQKFEVYNNPSNAALLDSLFTRYDVDLKGIPIVFLADTYLVGDKDIQEELENLIIANPDSVCPSNETIPPEQKTPISLVTLIGAALVDSINPCAIAVLLILLMALLAAGSKKRALLAGLAFTVSIYISYFLFGIGLFSAIQISGLAFWFYQVIGWIAIVIGLLNIKDFIWYRGGGFAMEIPSKWRPTLKGLLKKITSPIGAFLIGFVVCLFELPCTGGPYIFILGLLAERSTAASAIPLLLLYNLFFVLPLLIINLLVYFGFTTAEKTDKWKDKNIRTLHLVAGIIMLVLGVLVVTGIL